MRCWLKLKVMNIKDASTTDYARNRAILHFQYFYPVTQLVNLTFYFTNMNNWSQWISKKPPTLIYFQSAYLVTEVLEHLVELLAHFPFHLLALYIVTILHMMVFAQIGGYLAHFRVKLNVLIFTFAPKHWILQGNKSKTFQTSKVKEYCSLVDTSNVNISHFKDKFV